MRMQNQGPSRNVADLRGVSGSSGFGGRGIGIGGPVSPLIPAADTQPYYSQPGPAPRADDPDAYFVSQGLRSTEVVWGRIFAENGRPYEEARLRL